MELQIYEKVNEKKTWNVFVLIIKHLEKLEQLNFKFFNSSRSLWKFCKLWKQKTSWDEIDESS